jgi:hypothetical protein
VKAFGFMILKSRLHVASIASFEERHWLVTVLGGETSVKSEMLLDPTVSLEM